MDWRIAAVGVAAGVGFAGGWMAFDDLGGAALSAGLVAAVLLVDWAIDGYGYDH
jgi:hypothetical protein